MVVKSQIKLIKSLQQKKYRNKHNLFVVEGEKTVTALFNSKLRPYLICQTVNIDFVDADFVEVVSEAELKQMSGLKTPSGIIGVFYIPEANTPVLDGWVVALDDVRDPGNLGTIIRLCDWYNIPNLVCSLQTVDCYNPKVLQATMGSIANINILYTDLPVYLSKINLPVFGGFMNGDVVYKTKIPSQGVLVMGNEANGISGTIEKLVTQKVSIPQFGATTAESLNVATATAILLNEIKRSL